MQKPVLMAIMAVSAIAAIAAGTLAARQGVHFVGKVGPPLHPAVASIAPNPPLAKSDLIARLKALKVPVNTLSGPIHYDAANLVAGKNDFMIINSGLVNPVPNGGNVIFYTNGSPEGVSVYHLATANVPFVVDFQVSSISGGATFQTMLGNSSQTWNITAPTHALVAVYPTTSDIYVINIDATQGNGVVNGVDVSNVAN